VNIARGARLIQVMVPAGQVRPAETHYLVMLQRHLSANPGQRPPLNDLREALTINRQAEQVALALGIGEVAGARAPFDPYSERVFPWIKDLVLKADQDRRWGQDLLFATDLASWERARAFLNAAKDKYGKAAADAAVVRRAFQTRDQMMDVLPSYSHFLADRWVTTRNQWHDQLKELEDLWHKVHQLHHMLEETDDQSTKKLDGLTSDILKAFRLVEDEFAKNRKQLIHSASELPSRRREIDVLLATFWVDPEDRIKLLELSRKVSRKLFEQHLLRARGDLPAPGEPFLAHEFGQQQGRMAVATLGERWLARQAGATDLDGALLSRRLLRPEVDRWQQQFNNDGALIGQALRRLPETIRAHQDKAAKPQTELAVLQAELTAADQLCRQMDGALVDPRDAEAAVDCHRLYLHNLLIQLAWRTIADHWYADKNEATPYFAEAAAKFVLDARDQFRGLGAAQGSNRLADVNKVTEALKARPTLALIGPPKKTVTSERQYTMEYRLETGAGLPPGFPVVQARGGADMHPNSAGKSKVGGRAVRSAGAVAGPKSEAPVAYTFDHEEKFDQGLRKETSLTVEGLYRGRVVTAKTDVTLYYRPDTIAFQKPPPNYGGLAVRTELSIERQFTPECGELVIVLDCSGSMWSPLNPGALDVTKFKPRAGERRFDKAVDALERVLSSLNKRVKVSLWIFS
jgi:hypothetical protein